MSNYMNEHGKGCYPSVSKLAKACGLSERTVYRNIDTAIEAKFIVKCKRNIKGSGWDSNEYKATYPDDGLHGDAGHKCGDTDDRGGVTPMSGVGCHPCHTNSPMSSPIKKKKNTR